jgi:hypothetical protein
MSSQPDPHTPVVTLSSLAYLKLHLLALAPPVTPPTPNPLATRETVAILLPSADDPFHIVDAHVPRQRSTAATWDADPLELGEVFTHYPDAHPSCVNLLFHTHPGSSASPSGTDLDNWRNVQSTGIFGMMLIFGRPSSPTAFPDFSLRVRFPIQSAAIPGFPAPKTPSIYDGPARLLYHCPFRAFLESGTPFPLTPEARLSFLQSALAANPGVATRSWPTHSAYFSESRLFPDSSISLNEAIKRNLYDSLLKLSNPAFSTTPHIHYTPISDVFAYLITSSFRYHISTEAAPLIRDAWQGFKGTFDDFVATVLSPIAVWLTTSTTPYFLRESTSSTRRKPATSLSKWRLKLPPAALSSIATHLCANQSEIPPLLVPLLRDYLEAPSNLSSLFETIIEESDLVFYDERDSTFRFSWTGIREYGWSASDVSKLNSLLLSYSGAALDILTEILFFLTKLHFIEESAYHPTTLSDTIEEEVDDAFDCLILSLQSLNSITTQGSSHA